MGCYDWIVFTDKWMEIMDIVIMDFPMNNFMDGLIEFKYALWHN